ncbi:MAG: hypothetical protein Q9220_005257 [cf. Caloplaca sp. 1 TL-2023]
MKRFSIIASILVLANIVTAVPTATTASYSPPTKTFKELADFANGSPNPDGSIPQPDLSKPYKHLSFSNLVLATPLARLQLPSDPNYVANLYGGRPSLSINGTTTTSFDVLSFYAGCLAYPTDPSAQGYEVVNCQFSVQCDMRPSGMSGPFSLKFAVAEKMRRYTVGLRNCSNAYFDLQSGGGQYPFMVFDDFKLVSRQGEIFTK